jgi:demethylmenaquinone methyltransferase/2-methoxy-6-polyprenyl-1,4-benzoquinol methylase
MDNINKMFSKITPKYDLMNHVLSFNFDRSWRSKAAEETLIPKDEYSVLDVAAGTGDLSIAVDRIARKKGKKAKVYAYDFNKDMLALAKEKFGEEGLENIKIEHGNAFDIRHKTGSLDVVISGFALRSFRYSKDGRKGLQKFISESYRVLKPKGKVVLLDMAMPDNMLQRAFFSVYSVPMLIMGSFVDRYTYAWLVRTIKSFDKKMLVSMINSTGFRNTKIRSLRSGIAYLVTAEK